MRYSRSGKCWLQKSTCDVREKNVLEGIRHSRVLAELPADRRQRIEQQAAELIREELTLREVRRARKLTQARLSRMLKIGQEGVSRIEKRTDLYLSTLRSYVEGVGGKFSRGRIP